MLTSNVVKISIKHKQSRFKQNDKLNGKKHHIFTDYHHTKLVIVAAQSSKHLFAAKNIIHLVFIPTNSSIQLVSVLH